MRQKSNLGNTLNIQWYAEKLPRFVGCVDQRIMPQFVVWPIWIVNHYFFRKVRSVNMDDLALLPMCSV